MSAEVAQRGQTDPRRLPTLADGGPTLAEDVDPRLSLPRLHQTAMRRAAWLADRLADAVAAQGLAALVDDQHAMNATGELVRVGESIRALAELEGRERDRAERIAATMARIGLDARDRDRTQAEGRRLGQTVKEVCRRLGHDLADPDTLRVVREAVIAAVGDR